MKGTAGGVWDERGWGRYDWTVLRGPNTEPLVQLQGAWYVSCETY
jgi:hypothetical protein